MRAIAQAKKVVKMVMRAKSKNLAPQRNLLKNPKKRVVKVLLLLVSLKILKSQTSIKVLLVKVRVAHQRVFLIFLKLRLKTLNVKTSQT